MNQEIKKAFQTGSSVVVERCQVCDHSRLEPILFLGYLPPVNTMPHIGEPPTEQPAYPAQLLYCSHCALVQLGLIVDASILFPPEYPYTSSATKILRDNFAELSQECHTLFDLKSKDLIVDIGSNDGNLLSNFKEKHEVFGVTPEEIGRIANQRGIPTLISFFTREVALRIREEKGGAKIITATNVFAHMENINEVVESFLLLLSPEGIFISESHYFPSLVETLQYDTIYHEHLRYYSLHSLTYLLEKHGLEVIHAKKIPTHGGSIRVYAARKGSYPVQATVSAILKKENKVMGDKEKLLKFRQDVVRSKLELCALLKNLVAEGNRIYGIGAPSRATTLIHYVGLDEGILQCVLEIKGSHKVGKYIPGTLIPVFDEEKLFEDQPEYALFFSWHIADELAPKLKKRGFRGKFIVPLPTPRIVS